MLAANPPWWQHPVGWGPSRAAPGPPVPFCRKYCPQYPLVNPGVAQLAAAAGFPVLHGRQWHNCSPYRTATTAPVMLYCAVLLDAGGLAQLTAMPGTMVFWCHGGSSSPGVEVGGGGSVVRWSTCSRWPQQACSPSSPPPPPSLFTSSGPDGYVGPYPLLGCFLKRYFSQLLVILGHLVI